MAILFKLPGAGTNTWDVGMLAVGDSAVQELQFETEVVPVLPDRDLPIEIRVIADQPDPDILGNKGVESAIVVLRPDDFYFFELRPNDPNPFIQETVLPIEVPEETRVTLRIYDLLSREVAVPFDSVLPVGSYELRWRAEALPAAF